MSKIKIEVEEVDEEIYDPIKDIKDSIKSYVKLLIWIISVFGFSIMLLIVFF